jgi:anthranilate 1,2-dioxygenase small subunit
MESFSLVQNLLGRYARCLDDNRLEEWPEFFAEQCVYRVTSADNYEQGLPAGLIYADSKGMLQDRVASLREANVYEDQRYRHVLGAPLVLKQEDGVIEAETSFLVVRVMRDGQTILFASGRYIDRVRVQSTPVFAEKIVVCDSSRIDTLLAIPL